MNPLIYFKELLVEATESPSGVIRDSYHSIACDYLRQDGAEILKEIERLQAIIKGNSTMDKADMADGLAESVHDLLHAGDPVCCNIDRKAAFKRLEAYNAATHKMRAVA